ncbi:MAG: Holliday junction branch migration protein RuvA [Candidatus Pacebacteria bacterium]|nr:Holliday junction branch migration protein RuvA [Candidatus Paceibacterota bacterium]
MISYLKGKPLVQKDQLIILTGGVGYGVQVNEQLLTQAQDQDSLELYIYTHVKEDQLSLYGFAHVQELQLFKLLIGVSGIGPKTALSLVEAGSKQLIQAVQQAKVSFFTPIPRVGKKLAQKIIIELKPKLGSLKELNLKPLTAKEQDLIDALEGLGFAPEQTQAMIEELDLTELELPQAIKKLLKKLQ